MEQSFNYDFLNYQKNSAILSQLKDQKNDQIILSLNISKYNDNNKKQDRIIIITQDSLYNFKSSYLKFNSITKQKQTNLSSIRGLTFSINSNEFIIHIQDDTDYRYESQKNQLILDILVSQYFKLTNKAIPYYQVKEVELIKYKTTSYDKQPRINQEQFENMVPLKLKSKRREINQIQKIGTLYTDKDVYSISLQDFKVISLITKGSHGKVYLVEKNMTKQLYALVSILKQDITDESQFNLTNWDNLKLFKLNQQVDHINIVPINYCFHSSQRIFFMTPYQSNGDLLAHLQKRKMFSEENSKFIIIQVILAISYLHQYWNHIYKNLMAENVVFQDNGYIKLLDAFTSANIEYKHLDQNQIRCCPEYIAPEVIIGKGFSDWWSVGILLYELIVGIPPFYHKEQEFMLSLILEMELQFPTNINISTDCMDFIKRLLQKNPQKRIGNLSDFQEIKNHAWFNDVAWNNYEIQKVKPPQIFFDQIQELEKNDEQFNDVQIENLKFEI